MKQQHSSQWFDEQYDSRAFDPGSATVLERWAQASQFVREQMRCSLDLPYGEGARATLDVFGRAGAKAPVLVFVHGGGWRGLDKSHASFVAPSFTEEGAIVIIPDYELCPQVGMARIPLELTAALAWVWRHVAEFGGDPNQIVLAGHEAGAHLAAMLSCCDWKSIAPDLPRQLVKGCLAISGIYDLAPLMQSERLRMELKLDAATCAQLSPAGFPAPDSPTYAVVGAAETAELKRQCKALLRAWGARAVPLCEELPGYGQLEILYDLADPEGQLHLMAKRLLDLRWYSPLL